MSDVVQYAAVVVVVVVVAVAVVAEILVAVVDVFNLSEVRCAL